APDDDGRVRPRRRPRGPPRRRPTTAAPATSPGTPVPPARMRAGGTELTMTPSWGEDASPPRGVVVGGSARGEDLPGEVRGLRRGLADLDADGLEGLLLRGGRAGGAGDDGAGVAHRLALRGGEARDVADDRLRHVVLDEGRGALL